MKQFRSAILLSLTMLVAVFMFTSFCLAAPSKNTVNFRLQFNASTVSPYTHFNDADWWWQAGVYEPLVWLNDTDGSFEPMLAKEWNISEDGLTYTFKLRDDVVFHNGEKMTAKDCVYSYNLAKQAAMLATFTRPFASVEAVDDYTFVIKLAEPYYPFLHHSSMIKIISEKAVTEQGDAWGTKAALAGTGPYYMTEYNPAVKISLKAFDKYYRGKATIENINYLVMSDDSSAVIAFENGEIDMLQVPATYWPEIQGNKKYSHVNLPRHELYYLILNMNSPEKGNIIGNKLIRQAIGYCIDKEAIVEVVKQGLAAPAAQFMDPKITAGGPDATIVYEYDLGKARALLKEAGYPNGVDVGTLMSFAPAEYVKMAQIIQASCEEVGIKFKIEQMEIAAALTEMRAGRTNMAFCASTWLLDYDYIGRYFHSNNKATTFVKYNESDGINWKLIDQKFEEGYKVKDLAERKKIYAEAEREIMDSGTYYPIMMATIGMAWNKDLKVDTSKWGVFFMFSPYDWAWQ